MLALSPSDNPGWLREPLTKVFRCGADAGAKGPLAWPAAAARRAFASPAGFSTRTRRGKAADAMAGSNSITASARTNTRVRTAHSFLGDKARAASGSSSDGGMRRLHLLVDLAHLPGHVGPVEREDVLGGLRDEAVPQPRVRQEPLCHRGERLGVARAEAETDVLVRHDFAQTSSVGHEARTARGHRLERHEPERLVDR